MNSTKILIAEAEDFSQEVIERLKQYAEVDVFACEQKQLKALLEEYDVFWFRLGFQIDQSVLSEQTRCKIIATPVTGIDHIDEALCGKLGIKIICLRGEREFLKKVRATAEMAVGLAITVMRNIVDAANAVQKGKWERDYFRGHELYEKKVAIIGFGRLGAIVADYYHAFGMDVSAYDPRDVEMPSFVKKCSSIAKVVKEADLVSLHVNYQESTMNLINETVLSQFKKGAYFVNTARGGIVDENALLQALKNGHLAGAALDVIQNEHSVDENNPLIQYARENRKLLIVPHIGGNTYESFTKTEEFIASKIIADIVN